MMTSGCVPLVIDHCAWVLVLFAWVLFISVSFVRDACLQYLHCTDEEQESETARLSTVVSIGTPYWCPLVAGCSYACWFLFLQVNATCARRSWSVGGSNGACGDWRLVQCRRCCRYPQGKTVAITKWFSFLVYHQQKRFSLLTFLSECVFVYYSDCLFACLFVGQAVTAGFFYHTARLSRGGDYKTVKHPQVKDFPDFLIAWSSTSSSSLNVHCLAAFTQKHTRQRCDLFRQFVS